MRLLSTKLFTFDKPHSYIKLAIILVTMLTGCQKTCYCGRQCYAFNGNIQVCQMGPADAAHFAQVTDSLTHLYGQGTPIFADSVVVSGYANNAVSSITSQLKSQGYTCNCK